MELLFVGECIFIFHTKGGVWKAKSHHIAQRRPRWSTSIQMVNTNGPADITALATAVTDQNPSLLFAPKGKWQKWLPLWHHLDSKRSTDCPPLILTSRPAYKIIFSNHPLVKNVLFSPWSSLSLALNDSNTAALICRSQVCKKQNRGPLTQTNVIK